MKKWRKMYKHSSRNTYNWGMLYITHFLNFYEIIILPTVSWFGRDTGWAKSSQNSVWKVEHRDYKQLATLFFRHYPPELTENKSCLPNQRYCTSPPSRLLISPRCGYDLEPARTLTYNTDVLFFISSSSHLLRGVALRPLRNQAGHLDHLRRNGHLHV